ncbi:MAG: ABC transporter ATP-binding protein [Dehalococcoidales bacterium]|jgi:ATP-binding cassette subfamily B protein|nr:ABC transporter ATP-binding protein [Dehalococcoidales bacterium]
MKTVLRLFVFVRGQWKWLIVTLAFLFVGIVLSMIIPRMLGTGIDMALRDADSAFLWWPMARETAIWWVAGTIVAASALRGLAGYGQSYLQETISQKVSYTVRNAIYDRLQRLSFAYYDKAQTGQLMSRATVDVEAVRMFFGMGLVGIIQLVVMVVTVAVILLVMNWQLALMSMAFMPIIGWLAVRFSTRIRPLWMQVQEMMAQLGIILQESLIGVRIVKAFRREKEESRKFSTQATVLYDQHISIARQMATRMPVMMFVMSLPTILILFWGGLQVIDGNMTIGDLTQFTLYVNMMVMPVRQVGMMVNMITRTISAGQRILEILDTESAVKEKPDAIVLDKVRGEVTFDKVSFSYDSIAATLKDVSFRAEPGQLIALLGGSGSGKSTIANLISRFYDVTQGSIKIDGTDIRDVTIASLRRNVGISQQDIFLFSGSIKDNIAYGAVDATLEQVEEVAKAASLHDFIVTLPDGYETWVGERGLTLSGGEKQRLAIARTLLINPSILILDDSMSSVDADTEKMIRQALDQLIKGRTTFIITHRLPIIKNADLILMLEKGQVIEQGKHTELMAKKGMYYNVYESQLMSQDENITEDN